MQNNGSTLECSNIIIFIKISGQILNLNKQSRKEWLIVQQ